MSWDIKVAASHTVMDEAIAKYHPIAVFGLFSGGDDSLTATHVAAQHPAFTAAVHINTGIGIPETREFVRETCKREGWLLKEYRALEDCGQDYRTMVLDKGFPGPAYHRKMYITLKERALRKLLRDTKVGHKRRDCILLVSGCRSEESVRRMGNTKPLDKQGSLVWASIIHDWTKLDCIRYLSEHNIERNPVVLALHKSGECLCGAFAKKGELAEIALWYPKTGAYIRQLEQEVREAGHDWGWEEAPPKKRDKRQLELDIAGPLCWGCKVDDNPND